MVVASASASSLSGRKAGYEEISNQFSFSIFHLFWDLPAEKLGAEAAAVRNQAFRVFGKRVSNMIGNLLAESAKTWISYGGGFGTQFFRAQRWI